VSSKQPTMRLDRLLANLGYGTRREVERVVWAGLVVLDGDVLEDADQRIAVTPDLSARMTFDGAPLDPPPGFTLMLHKPVGVTCSHKEQGPLVYSLLPERWRRREPAIELVARASILPSWRSKSAPSIAGTRSSMTPSRNTRMMAWHTARSNVGSPGSNRTAVSFGISNNDAEATAAFRKKSQFVFERPISPQSIHKTLKPAYGLILRERRRYFRCPVSIPVIIRSESMQEVWCNSVNISGGGMALSTQVPFLPGENVRVQFTLPDHEVPLSAESTICWSKTDNLGVRFVSISDEQKSVLQVWLSQKLEETLPEGVAGQFRKAELC